MEVLLLTSIPGIGKKNDLIVVSDGFALNHLLPGRRALVVTPSVRKRYAEQIKERALEREREKQLQESIAKALGGKTLRFAVKAGKGGKLYAAVSEKMIADGLLKDFNVTVSSSHVKIASPIKSPGKHTVILELGAQSLTLPVEVTSEESKPKAKAK